MDKEQKQKLYITLYMFLLGVSISAISSCFIDPLIIGSISVAILIGLMVYSHGTGLFYSNSKGDLI